MAQFLERAKSVYSNYILAIPEEKRDLLNQVTSNRFVDRKNVEIELKSAFQVIENEHKLLYGPPQRDTPRTLEKEVAGCENNSTPESSEAKIERLFKLLYDYFMTAASTVQGSDNSNRPLADGDIIPIFRDNHNSRVPETG
jgi:hypothetical protein